MDVRLTTEQRDLRASAARIVDTLGPRTVVDLDDATRTARLDAAVAAAGWRELRQTEGDGRPLASGVEAALIAEQLGRGLADVAFLGPVLASDLGRRAGLTSDACGYTVALSPDLLGLADAAGGGVATAIDVAGSRGCLVTRAAQDVVGLAVIDIPTTVSGVDLTRSVAGVDTSLAGALPGQPGSLDAQDVAAWTAFALALTCADLVGVMRGAVGLARDYAALRHQFGTAIGSFQAVQHLIADALVATEGAYSVALHAAWAADALAPADALHAARLAKAYCSKAARTVCETTIQVHGGIGNTWECLAHVYLRRAHHSTEILGGAEVSLGHVLESHGIGGGGDGLRRLA